MSSIFIYLIVYQSDKHKTQVSNPITSFVVDKGTLLTKQSIAGVSKLKTYTSDRLALKEVEKIEKRHVLWSLAKLVGKIVLLSLTIYFIPVATALIPIAGIATILKVSAVSIGVLKLLFLTLNTVSVYKVWHLSCKGFEGTKKIIEMEALGFI